jgi:recA bacterial DNA recombination protein
MEALPKGAISEIFGCVSSGKTLVLQELLASASARGEFCAVVDSRGAFDPLSAARAGMDLRRLLWVRAGHHAEYRAEHGIDRAFKAADLILHAGGFGMVVLDLCEVPLRDLNSIPLSYWYRFRLAVENTPTSLIVTGDQPLVKSCARVQIEVKRERLLWRGPVFEGIDFELVLRKTRAIANPDLLRMAG